MEMEGLKEEVIFNFKTLEELLIEEDMIIRFRGENIGEIIDDTRGKEEEMRVELMIRDKNKNTIILDIDFKMFTISNTTEGITENTGGIIKFAVIIEFIEIRFTDIRGFTMFRVDKNGWFTITFNLDITRVMLMSSEKDIRVGKGFKKDMMEEIFGHLSFKRGITGEIIMKRGESIMNIRNFMMNSMRVEGSGEIFKKIRLKIRKREERFTIEVI
jgi:hypothetical protein